jgi:hypothetical protein
MSFSLVDAPHAIESNKASDCAAAINDRQSKSKEFHGPFFLALAPFFA